MPEARMFTEEELKEMGAPIAERIQAAIEAHDLVMLAECDCHWQPDIAQPDY